MTEETPMQQHGLVIKACMSYTCKESFEFQDVTILEGDKICINLIATPVVYCDVYRLGIVQMKQLTTIEVSIIRLIKYIDLSSETPYIGACELCHSLLTEQPKGSWGFGYVCKSCAYKFGAALEG